MELKELKSIIQDYEPYELIGHSYQENYDIIYCEWWLPVTFSGREIIEIMDDLQDEVGARIIHDVLDTADPSVKVLQFDVSLPR